MKRFFILLFCALLAVSCLSGWDPVPESAEEGLVERTWTVTIDPGTRATLDEALYPIWEVGEKLSVYDPKIQSGRAFTVTEVNGHTATISGKISEGDFPFDAIYPSKSAGAWASDGTNRAKLPATQVIPAGRNLCPDVLVSTAHSEHPEAGVVFHNAISLLRFRLERDDVTGVAFELLSGEETRRYEAISDGGYFAPGEYYLAVDPDTYSRGLTVTCTAGVGLEYAKQAETPLSAAKGGILSLGTVSDGTAWRAYEVTKEQTYAKMQTLLDETGVFAGLDNTTLSFVNLLLLPSFSDRDKPVRAIDFTYPSRDPQGRKVTLSARLYVPQAVLNGEKTLDGIALANHGTITSNAECPTMSADFEAIFAWKNYAIVMPDYYGFGASKDRPQAYLDPFSTAEGSIGAYLAALQLLADHSVSPGRLRFNYGYSQGGFNTVANLRFLTEHPELDIHFTKSFAGGSPFDVPVTWESYLQGGFDEALSFIPLTLVSINESQQLGLNYARLFQEPLLSNWRTWILSKQYNRTSIDVRLAGLGIADMLTADMMARQGPEYEAIMAVCRRYSLTAGWEPEPGTRLMIYHSTGDDIVPYANFTAMKTYLNAVAPDCEISWVSESRGGHVMACIFFMIKVLNGWKE